MKRPLHQLILLGLICQGLSWDDHLLPGLYALAWCGLLVKPAGVLVLGKVIEGPLLVLGCAGAFLLGERWGYGTHFFLGHGLALVQLARLTRPLKRREEIVSVMIALFHLAVACTFLTDYRFVAIIAATVWLLPRTLTEIQIRSFTRLPAAGGEVRPHPVPQIGLGPYLLVLALMVGFFLVFPRASWTGALPLPSGSLWERDTLLDTVIDPARSVSIGSRRILFQVQGERVGYLRCYALTEFDGHLWKEDRSAALVRRNIPSTPPPGDFLHRSVRAKNPTFFGNMAPVDGCVVGMCSSFFSNGYYTLYGMVITTPMTRGANNIYEYWIAPTAPREDIRRGLRKRLTECPLDSEPMKAWLDQTLTGVTSPYDQARHLERHLRNNFTYELGGPVLDRLNPIEDFVLREKKGHCERFAAALAALLRMKDIPSRVVIGYLPISRNWITGWYDIRLCDAHAWTEAWFPDQGWVRFDATPATTVPRPPVWRDWFEAVDFAWYTHVVNYDAPTQTFLLSTAASALGFVASWGTRHAAFLALLPVAVAIWWLVRRRALPNAVRRVMPGARSSPRLQAEHFYGKMLRLLDRQGYHRPPHQTPFEFLEILHAQHYSLWTDVRQVTHLFCAVRYGNQPITPAEQVEVKQALQRLQAVTPFSSSHLRRIVNVRPSSVRSS